MVRADFQRPHRLEQAFLERSAHAHDLAGRLHLRGEPVGGAGELIERETRHFGDDIVQRRLKAGGRVGKQNLVQVHSHRNLRRHPRNGEAACLACQCRGARHAGVDLDDIILEGIGIQRELHVAAALDAETADDLQRAVAEHLIFAVGQRLAGADHHRVAGMHADRIEIFHIADHNRGVVRIAHDLVFDLLVALDALFHQHLVHRGKLQRVCHQCAEFRIACRKSAAGAAQGERRAQNHRVADLFRRRQSLLHRFCNLRGADRLADLLAQRLEQLAVLGFFDALAPGAEQLRPALAQNALLFQLHGKVQSRLPAQARNDRVRALVADDLCHVFQRQRLHVHLVRNARVGHDGCRVGVAEHHLVPLLLQRQARLRSRIVELRRLPDDNRTAPDDHDFLQIRSLRHSALLRTASFPQQTGQTDTRCPPAPARSPDGTAPKRRDRPRRAVPPPCRPEG